MFTVTKYPQGTISWADCSSTDVEKSKQFYADVLGWNFTDVPMGDGQFYTMYEVDGKSVAGLGPQQGDIPSIWNTYISVDDVDAMAAKVTELGGSVHVPPMDVFDSGRMMVFQDPTGAYISLWQPKNHIGAGLVNTVGAMCWNELMTRDVEKAKTFFADLLGWEYQKMDGMDYWLIMNNGRMNGGIMPIGDDNPDMPPNWSVYFNVADIDEAMKKVEASGGKQITPIMGEADTSPGRFVPVSDPSGAVLLLIQAIQADPWEDPA